MTLNETRHRLLLISFFLCSFSLFSQNWKIQKYTEENGLPNNYLYTLSDEKESILIGSDVGLLKFDGHTFEVDEFFKNMYPIDLERVSDSFLYISTFRNGIYVKRKKSLEKISRAKGGLGVVHYDTNFVLREPTAKIVVQDSCANRGVQDHLAAYSKGYGVSARKEGIYFHQQKKMELIDWQGNRTWIKSLSDSITTVFSLNKSVFIGHKYGKLVHWKNGEELVSFQLETDYDIQNIYQYNDSCLVVVNTKDEYDQLFFLTFNKGFTKLLKSDKLINKMVEINDVLIKKGTVFLATYGEGLFVLNPTAFFTIDIHSQNLPPLKKLIEDKDGTIWANSVQNVYCVDMNNGVSKLTFSSKLMSLVQAKNESFISLSAKGLSDMNLNVIVPSNFPIKEVLYSNDSILLGYGKYSFIEVNLNRKTEAYLFNLSKEKTIYGKFNAGAYTDTLVHLGTDIGLIELKKTKDGKWKKIQASRTLSYFKGRRITQLTYHRDTLFVIAEGRLFFSVNDKIREFVFSKKANIQVNRIMFDSKSNLFIATDKGFWCIKSKEVLHYDKSNGLLSEKVYNFLEDKNANIWVVTGKSLEIIKYEDLHSVRAPKLFFRKTIKRDDGISLTISSYQYDFPDDLELEYKLNDEEWIPLKTSLLELRNLAPKSYSCYVRGKRNNSTWSKSLVYKFEVEAEWYQTNVFKISVFLLLLVLSFIIFRIRLRKVRAKNFILENEIAGRKRLEKKVSNLREEISQDFHDELGNKIASISGISNAIIGSVEMKHVPKIRQISKLSSEMYDSTKDFVWLLDPDNNNLSSLCMYLRDHGENYFDLLGDIDFFFYQENIQSIPISYEWMKNIVLTFKEITTNVIKHSSATEVTMDVRLEGDIFSIQIYDNGQGFDEDAIKYGNGLRNIKTRMQKINAEISTSIENGVKYCFKLKVK